MPNDRFLDEFPDVEGEALKTGTQPGHEEVAGGDKPKENRLVLLWEILSRAGLGETAFRAGTHLLSIAMVLVVVWAMRAFYLHIKTGADTPRQGALAAPLPTATPTEAPPEMLPLAEPEFVFTDGIPRLVSLHTTLPTRPRTEVITYTVQKDDTIFGIADKFALNPKTILWGNYYTLRDDPHMLQPGTVLNILSVNGTYHKWSAGEGLNGVSKYYGVKPEDIINWPGNHLDPAKLGDWSHPNIEPGTMLVVPGGHREFVTWSAPWITRKDPAVAKLLGPGFCGTMYEGAVGMGSFVWPTTNHWLSGFNYSPDTNHPAIDIAGQLGNPVFAADNGVIVYAGWNNWGYGNVVVIDHGNGWQTLYAHLSYYGVGCGLSVNQGDVIGSIGSTGNSSGPHLHFEMMYQGSKVNPFDFLPPP